MSRKNCLILQDLEEAIKKFDEEKFRNLFCNHKSEINAKSVVFYAARIGFVAGIRVLLESGIDVLCTDYKQRNIFHNACKYGNTDLIKFVLDDERLGKLIKQADREYQDALDIAVACDQKDIVRILLKSGKFSIDDVALNGNSRLFDALSRKDEKSAKYLIELGADIKFKRRKSFLKQISCICHAAMLCPCVLKVMVQNGGNVNDTYDGKSVLMLAMDKADRDTICFLLRSGADIEFKDKSKKNFLSYMSNEEQLYGVIDAGITINTIETKFEFSTLCLLLFKFIPIRQTKEKFVSFLLDNGADPNMKDNDETVLIRALKSERYRDARISEYTIPKQLIKYGADIHQVDVKGLNLFDTFLDVEHESPSFGYFLLESGAKPDCDLFKVIKKVKGDPEQNEWTAFVKTLLDKGANPNGKTVFDGEIKCCSGTTCFRANKSTLHSICMLHIESCNYFLELLMSKGARLTLVDLEQKSCLDILIEHLSWNIEGKIFELQLAEEIKLDCSSIELILKAGGEQIQIHGNKVLRTLIEFGLFKTAKNIILCGWILQYDKALIAEIETGSFIHHKDIVILEDLMGDFKDFLLEVWTNPPSLKTICRNTIRRQMLAASDGQYICPLIERLPLPMATRKFVGLENIDWASTEIITANPPPRTTFVNQWRNYDSDDFEHYDDYDDYNDDYSDRKEMFFNTETDEWEPAWW